MALKHDPFPHLAESAAQLKGPMESIGNSEFLTWADWLGIELDHRYQASDRLFRYWWLPEYQGYWPHFASCFLTSIDRWEAIVLWPRGGHWLLAPGQPGSRGVIRDRLFWSDVVRGVLFRGVQVPNGWTGGLRFSRQELGDVIAIMFAHMAFGGCRDDDLYLIPDHGQQCVEVNNDDLVYVKFREESRLAGFVDQMAAQGYHLPSSAAEARE